MKHQYLYYLPFLLAASLSACMKEDAATGNAPESDLQGRVLVFNARAEGPGGTRTTLSEDGAEVLWSPGDHINVFYRYIFSGDFVAQNTEPAATTQFSGTLTVASGSTSTGDNSTTDSGYFWAAYPYAPDNTCDGVSVTMTLPAEQTAAEGTIADGILPCIARSKGMDFYFYQVCGGVRFILSQEGITSVSLKSNASVPLAGKARIEFDENNKPYVQSVLQGEQTVTVRPPAGETAFKAGKTYYMVMLPATLDEGFTFYYTKGGVETALPHPYSSVAVERAKFGYMTAPDKKKTMPGPLSEVTATPDAGMVTLTWKVPAEGDYYCTVITFTNDAGETEQRIVKYDVVDETLGEGYSSITIHGFEEADSHVFTLTPCSVDGQSGPSSSISSTPEAATEAYKHVLETVAVVPAVEGALLTWENRYDVPVTLEVQYTDLSGAAFNQSVESSTDGQLSLPSIAETTSVRVTTLNEAGDFVFNRFSVTPLKGEIPVERISISSGSGFWQAGYEYRRLLDRDSSTYWHSPLTGSEQYFVAELGGIHRINAIEIVRRQNEPGYGSPITHVKVSTSADGSSYSVVHDDDFDAKYVFGHVLAFPETTCRFIRVDVTASGSWCHAAEFLAYWSDDPAADSPYAATAAEEIASYDVDSTVLPGVDYWGPMTDAPNSWINNLTFVQPDDRSNDTEWLFLTTGSDPWMPLKRLGQDAAGTVLEFQYQCNDGISIQFYWCDEGGFDDNGPSSSRVTSFFLEASDKWRYFRRDFADDWAKHNWPGTAGCTVRMDIGNRSDISLRIRNMHWRAAQ